MLLASVRAVGRCWFGMAGGWFGFGFGAFDLVGGELVAFLPGPG